MSTNRASRSVSKNISASLAAAAAMVASGIFAQHAKAATLNQYYVNGAIWANSGLFNLVESIVINNSNPVVTLPLGDYLSFGIADVLTNNTNPDAGNTSGTKTAHLAQPTNLGLYSIGYSIPSSDVQGTTLSPNPGFVKGVSIRGTLSNGQTAYYTTAIVIGFTAPTLAYDPGDTEYNTTTPPLTGGEVGMNFVIFAGANPSYHYNFGNSTGTQVLAQFTPTDHSNNGTLANSTVMFTNLSYKGLKAGTVTLSPVLTQNAYWVLATSGTGNTSTGTSATYNSQSFGTNDTISPLPVLLVNIAAHPIISLSSSAPANNYGATITNGGHVNQGTFSTGTNKLTVSGSNGHYTLAQVQNIDAEEIGNVEANGFNPSTDVELYGLDVTTDSTGATQLSASNLAILAADINSTNAYGFGSTIASTSLANDPFPAKYNLFLTFGATQPVGSDVFLGWDLSQDPIIPSGAAVSAVAVVPEPMNIGLLALGAVGILNRRRRSPQ